MDAHLNLLNSGDYMLIWRYPGHLILSLTFLLSLSNPLHAELRFSWSINDLAKIDAPTIELMSPPDFPIGKNKPLKKIDTKQMIYLYSVMKAIEEVSETRAELFIVNGDSTNAFASTKYVKLIPSKEQIITTRRDGSARIRANSEFAITYDEQSYHVENDRIIVNVVGINFAMLDFLGTDVHMAAALIGHELAHIKLEHGKNRDKKKDTATFSVKATRYLRDHEREADYLGAVWAVEAGYDPQGAVRLEELLMEKNKKRRSGYSLTHPSSRERLIKIKSLARRLSR